MCVCLSVYLFLCWSVSVCLCLSVCPCLFISFHLYAFLSVCLCVSACLSVLCVSMSVYASVSLSVSVSQTRHHQVKLSKRFNANWIDGVMASCCVSSSINRSLDPRSRSHLWLVSKAHLRGYNYVTHSDLSCLILSFRKLTTNSHLWISDTWIYSKILKH